MQSPDHRLGDILADWPGTRQAVFDLVGGTLACDPLMARMLGYDPAGIEGKDLLELSPPLQVDGAASAGTIALRIEAARAGLPQSFEWRFLRRDGEALDVLVRLERLAGRGGEWVRGTLSDVTENKRIDHALRNVALGVSGATDRDIFQVIVRYLGETLGVCFAYVGKFSSGPPERIHTLAVYMDGKSADNVTYDLADTPCDKVVGKQFYFVPSGIQTLYPGDNLLRKLKFDGYAAYPLFDSRGAALGLIAVLDRKPLRNQALTESILKIFSVRAAAELERLQADEARRISEASYRAIFEASVDPIFVHDIDTGAIVDVNAQVCDIYGYTRDEIRSLTVAELSSGIPPYTEETAQTYIARAAAGMPQRFEWHRRNKDDSLHWDEVYLKRITLAGVDRVVAFIREITERKEREVELARSEGRLRATVAAALDCIIGMDSAGCITEFNPAAEECFGYRRAEVLGRPLAEVLIPSRYREAHQRGLRHYQNTGEGRYLGERVEVQAARADGTEFPAELAIGVAEGREDRMFIGYLRDISARKEAEAERGRLEAQLRQAQKMEAIGHLTGGIAHDFNNILTGIMGYIVMAQEWQERQGDAALGRYLERARGSAQRARDLIQQMLTFSRGQHGEPRPLALTPLVEESVALLKSTLPSSVEFTIRSEGELPEVMVDPVHIEQVLMNLCINARDAMKGSGRLDLTLHRRETEQGCVCSSCRRPVTGSFVELAVRDNGPGIDPAVLDRMFEPFYSTKEVGKGSGMGLSTVHGIVHDWGGHVVVDTGIGAGSAFRVLIPALVDAGEAAEDTGSEAGAAQSASARQLRGKVLLVEDDPTVREFMADRLGSWGLEVTESPDAREALGYFMDSESPFGLVVLDQTMPKMTGTEFAARLLERFPEMPVILYTGYSDNVSETEVKGLGIRALVRKPIDDGAFFELLKEHLPALTD